MKQQVGDSVAQPRLRSALLGVFSLVALILASLGIYGVIACSVAERKKEIGIRIALGARPSEVRNMVLRQGLTVNLDWPCVGPGGRRGRDTIDRWVSFRRPGKRSVHLCDNLRRLHRDRDSRQLSASAARDEGGPDHRIA